MYFTNIFKHLLHVRYIPLIIVIISITVMRHQGHGNSNKGKHLIGLEFQKFSPLSSWQEVWRHISRHDTFEGVESFTS